MATQNRDNLDGTTTLTKEALEESNLNKFTDDDIQIVQYVAALVSQRAALLVSITTAVLLHRIPCKDVTIAIDGSVYKKHPRMHGWLLRLIEKLAPPEKVVSKKRSK